jgi:hypothetical protein
MTTKAEQRILDRFDEIEAALLDLKPREFGVFRVQDLIGGGLIERRYSNRLMGVFLLLYHLQDDVKRLAKRKRLTGDPVSAFTDQSLWVKLCIRAGNTHKHGFGGRSRNATYSNGLLYVVKIKSGEKPSQPSPNSEAIVIGMIVADADYGVFHSQSIIEGALHDWAHFLSVQCGLDLSCWLSRCVPAKQGPTVRLQHSDHPDVPLGATVVMEIPTELTNVARRDAARRRDEA